MQAYRSELVALTKLAVPLVMAFLVSMAISITDVVMMGWLGSAELATGAATSDFYSIIYYLLAGVISAVSPILAQARGANEHDLVRRATQQGFWVALVAGLPGAVLIWNAASFLSMIGINEEIVNRAGEYAHMMAFTLMPMLGVMVCHHYLSTHGRAKALFYTTAVALPVNAFGNYTLMFGHFGSPALGLAGAGLSSAIVGTLMFTIMLSCVVTDARSRIFRLFVGIHQPNWRCSGEILRVGIPIGGLALGEVGIFLLSTIVIGVFGVDALAAHAVTLRCAGVVYAIPVGLAQAATIRVGIATGSNDSSAMYKSAKTALGLALCVGFVYVVCLLSWRHEIAKLFLGADNHALPVFFQSILFLSVLAAYQPFQCLGTVTAGVLRGIKDTQTPMMVSLLSYWGVGGSTALLLTVFMDIGAIGIWFGLATGAAAFGMGMTARFMHFRQSSDEKRFSEPELSGLLNKTN